MRYEDFTLTPEEAQRARRKRRMLVLAAVALVLVIVAGVFGARPAAHAIKAWQARRHAQKAFVFIEKEQWSNARNEAVAALQLRPSEPQALRAIARFLSRTHQVEALDFWEQLDKRHFLTTEDRREEATIAIIAADNDRAERAVRELLSSRGAGPADWLLAAQLANQRKSPGDARPYLEKIVADPRTNETEALQASLIQVGLADNDQAHRTDAIARIKKIATGESATSLDALVAVAKMALSTPLEEMAPSAGNADRERLSSAERAQGPEVEGSANEATLQFSRATAPDVSSSAAPASIIGKMILAILPARSIAIHWPRRSIKCWR